MMAAYRRRHSSGRQEAEREQGIEQWLVMTVDLI